MAIPKLASYPMPTVASFPANKVNWALDPSRAVLLIHDMQEYFLDFYGEDSPLVAQLVANVVALRAWCHAQGIPVVYTAQPSEQSPQDRALLNDMWGPGLTTASRQVQQVVAPLRPLPQDTVLVKWRYSAFIRSPLEQMIKEGGRDQLIICGVYAHIGCMVSATEAFMRDIKPFFVGDALADFSEEEHRMALRYVATRSGFVTDVQSIIGQQGQALDQAWLLAQLTPFLDADDGEPGADDNLMDYGLDSVQVMTLIGNWQRDGLDVSFAELASKPTLAGWLAVLSAKRQAA
ncbi:isochorismatase family protein [Pseudomonas sp. App30]|uniref:isochorismatase family protein n=1 Tax=Pseudomonas sp. App30 TaxID=3068990 RepID=UPI003A7FD3E9